MKTSNIFLYIFFCMILASCSSNEESSTIDTNVEYTPLKDEDEYEKFIAEIDMNDTLMEVGSLSFTKEDGSEFEVSAFLDGNKKIVKLVQRYVNGQSKEFGTTSFYFKSGVKIVSKERFEDHSNVKPKFIERISYYKNEEFPLKTKFREANLEEELDQMLFMECKKINCSSKNAEDALNQSGEFITTFQGFVETGKDLFLTVGENKKDGYVSALMVQAIDENIKKLQQTEILMIGKQLTVNFERMTDASGFQFQVLTGIKILD